jgi:HTH-type transcriptional regulator/antitoxin HigA
LLEFGDSLHGRIDQRAVRGALESWFDEVRRAHWRNAAEVKSSFATASIITAERIVFNIKGNAYRLVAAVDFSKEIVWIKWIGSHRDYDGIDVRRFSVPAELKPIRTKSAHEKALAEVARLWGAKTGTREGDRLEILATLIDLYESEHYPIDPPDPIDAIKFRMEQQGLSRKDLEPMIGSRTRVAEVLNRKRALSITMIRRLHEGLGIPADILIRTAKGRSAA